MSFARLKATTDWPILRADAHGSRKKQRQDLMEYLDKYLRHCDRTKCKGALIFDIDDTLVDHRERPIREVYDTYQKFRHRFPTYIVTARPSCYRKETEDMLRRNQITYDKLFLLPPREEHDPGLYKWRLRRQIAKKHGRVLAACGDQSWDALPWPPPRSLSSLVNNPHNGALVRNENEVGILLPSSKY